jgi:RNA polymerase sigma-70 factor (ECF subfamily)
MGDPAYEDDSVVIRPLAFRSDEELVQAIRDGDRAAKQRLFEKYAKHVARVLVRCLGARNEISDLIHEVFVIVYRDLARLREPNALKAWLASISVYVARGFLRHKRRRRWLTFFAPEELPEPPAPVSDDDARAAIRATYAILDTLPDDERIAFALRFIDQMELTEVAAACKTSLATIKRRLARAQRAFVEAAREDAQLERWLAESTRWGDR